MKKKAFFCIFSFKLLFEIIIGSFFLLAHLPAYSLGSEIDCESYKLREFRKTCKEAVSHDNQVIVHDEISGDLSDAVKSWSENTFHIIPSGIYKVGSTVVLDKVTLLPHPKAGDGLETIELEATETFSTTRSPGSLISLTKKSKAGGIKIQGENLPGQFLKSATDVFLVDLPSAESSLLTGATLIGHSELAGLLNVEDGDGSEGSGGVDINRNYLKLNQLLPLFIRLKSYRAYA